MSKPVSYTPPDLQASRSTVNSAPVRRRHVFYLPGYDPESRTRYRLLFVRELLRHAKRFGEGKREISRASLSDDELVQSWSVAAHPATGGAETHYDVLLWDDIVAKDFARPRFVSLALLIAGTLYAIWCGRLFTLYRLNWKYGNIIIYPFLMLLLLAFATAAIATVVHANLADGFAHSLGWPFWLTVPLGLMAGLGCVRAIESLLNRIYYWQLVNDWVFNWQHGQGFRPDYERRVDVFTDRVLARLQAYRTEEGGLPDEIVVVGHSSGALTAVELTANLLARDSRLGTAGPGFSLVTLGSAMPIVAVQPRAHRLRAQIASIVTTRRVFWVDYVAPQDWLNFPWFNPIRDVDLGLGPDSVIANPTIRSARFRDIIDDETYEKVRFRPFRMHFQFLMANDKRGAYDFFAMTLGPKTVRERALAEWPESSTEVVLPCETVAA